MSLFNIIKEKNKIKSLYPLIGEGGYSKVFLINENKVLKISNHKSDGFRHISNLNKKQRNETGFVDIYEKIHDKESDLMYFLMERLYPLSISEEQKIAIKRINIKLSKKDYSFDFSQHNDLEKDIIRKIFKLKIYLPSNLDYDWDLNFSNIMVDKFNNLKLSDPISECMPLLKEYCTPDETKRILYEKNSLIDFLAKENTTEFKI